MNNNQRDETIEKGLGYVFDEQTRLIILGTFPSIRSRNVCYYNNPSNQFWKIMAAIFDNAGIVEADSSKRYVCLLRNGIGLWDVIASCGFETKSSLDSKIKKDSIKYNDFALLLQKCPNLCCIVFNSKNAQKLFDRYLKQEKDTAVKTRLLELTGNGNNVLPSTSSANARKSYIEKLKLWRDFIKSHVN